MGLLQGIPFWVYFAFLYVMVVGVRGCSDRTIPIQKLLILPIFFLLWSIASAVASAGAFVLWSASLAMGLLGGFLWARTSQIESDREKGTIRLMGSPSTLILLLLIFAVKFSLGYLRATQEISFAPVELFLAGAITGIFSGRSLTLFLKWKKSPAT